MVKVPAEINETPEIFKEVQHVRQRWIWTIVVVISILTWYIFAQQIIFSTPVGKNPVSNRMIIIVWLIFGVGLPAFVISARLETRVRSDGIYLRFIPWQRTFRKIALDDLHVAQVRNYRPLLEFGGWGIRKNRQGRAYTISGTFGVQLLFNYEAPLLIGSQRPDELSRAIQSQCDHLQSEKSPAKDT
ncbi:MAG: hypothetical protein JW920_09895 [Deltaproteobacteria bacterium]|nr:hypothetical protein [Deltaproteobacteria bacterium]